MPTDKEMLIDLLEKTNKVATQAAINSTHLEHMRENAEVTWAKLDTIESKVAKAMKDVEVTVANSLKRLPCIERHKFCDGRFSKLEVSQGVTNTKLAAVVTGAIIVIQSLIWLAQWGLKTIVGGGGVQP